MVHFHTALFASEPEIVNKTTRVLRSSLKKVAAQLHTHLSCNNLDEQFQSGFRPLHSTETALLQMTNDLLLVDDSGLLSIFLLLDLSAAFYTISHNILLDKLYSIGITNTPLKWFHSYLSGRSQFIQLK